MNATIITIGDELLIGQVVDTNSAWLGQQLSATGIALRLRLATGDDKQEIINALNIAKEKSDIILITGGLGPTKDDITKKTLCDYFGANMIFNEEIFADVKFFFDRTKRPMLDANRAQAELPDNCTPIRNRQGTAPGMWFEQDGKIFVSMPGVPFEMKTMMTDDVIPMLKKKFSFPHIIHRTIITAGIGESFLAEKIAKWEDALPAHVKLAYLPNLSQVRLRITAHGNNEAQLKEEIKQQEEKLLPLINEHVYGYENDTLEKVIGDILKQRNQTLSTAESCTGGFIAHKLTSIPGSSAYYAGSVITYSYELKEELLGVKRETLEKYGAVSEQTVIEMARGAVENLGTDYSIAVSGIAGPDGGTPDKPVGTVWIAIGTRKEVFAKQFTFFRNRAQNIEMTTVAALNMLRMILLGK